MKQHVCRQARPVNALEGPAWAMPGEIVKLADEENWGRVEMLYRCCHTYEVRLEAVGEQEAGVRSLAPEALENAYDAYPVNTPPRGYPVPRKPGGRQAVRQ